MLSTGATGTLEPPMVGAEPVMHSWFFEVLMLVIVVVPLVVLFGYAVFDVIRRHDIGVAHKAIWLIVFCLVPIVGPLVYLVIRPPG